jgi:hypothetical protein
MSIFVTREAYKWWQSYTNWLVFQKTGADMALANSTLQHKAAAPPSLPGDVLVSSVLENTGPRLHPVAAGMLPDWPISHDIIQVAQELLELHAAGPKAKRAGVPPATADLLTDEAERAAQILGQIADRVAAVAAQNLSPGSIQEALNLAQERVRTVSGAAHTLRRKLGILTLNGTTSAQDVEEITARARDLGNLADTVVRLLANSEEPSLDNHL